MRQYNNGISEEHIVAYLDGELNVNGEMREALGDAQIRHATNEYAAMKKMFLHSATEQRFRLKKLTDARVLAYLHDMLRAGNRNLPDAAPVRIAHPVRARTKNFWAKRTAIGFAFALCIALVWFVAMPKDEQAVTPVAQIASPQPTAPQVQPSETVANSAELQAVAHTQGEGQVAVVVKKSRAPITAETKVTVPTPQENPANIAQQESSPADIMISRRYAKLIKDVRVVEVTQQDKM